MYAVDMLVSGPYIRLFCACESPGHDSKAILGTQIVTIRAITCVDLTPLNDPTI
jgi:hypothetical protein